MSQIERWRSMVGERSERVWNVVERGAVRRFAEAIGDPNPLYVDEAAAKGSRYGALVAPPTFPRTFEYGEIRGMGWPEGGMLHGEHRIEYRGGPLRVGEEIYCFTELKDYYEKESRGGLLGFVVVERSGETPAGERRFTMQDVAVVTPALRRTLENE
jgi:acyl dehydratase